MLHRIRQRLRDMRTLRLLFMRAEQHALAQGQRQPGAEHFLLAAFDLPDGSARRALARVGANPDAVAAAIEQQYRDALAAVGIHADMPPPTALPSQPGIYRAQPSGQDLVQTLVDFRKGRPGPLMGAHLVELIAALPHGVAAGALGVLHLDANALVAAARQESAASA